MVHDYRVEEVCANSDRLGFGTITDLPTSATGGLVLHVCDEEFHFGDGPDANTDRDTTYSGATAYTYT